MKVIQYIKFNKTITKSALLSGFILTLLALTSLFPLSKGEQTTEAVTGTAQGSSLTLDIISGTASVDLTVTSTDGTFASSATSGTNASFSVTTNNFSGYTLSIIGSNNNGLLYDEDNTNSLTSIENSLDEASFSSSTSTIYNGKWGYKPSKYNSKDNTNYLPAPTTTATTLDATTTKNDTANNYTITLGARTDYTTPSALYSNTFTIIAVTNPVKYTITYDANTTETVSNMPGTQNSSTSETSIILSDKTPTREDYTFLGWCTIAPAASTPEICSGTTFQPGEAYEIDKTTENITTLYAVWERDLVNVGYIQDFTYSQCKTLASAEPVISVDQRDNKEYQIRYINGVCAMIDNLALKPGTTITSSDSNVSSSYTIPTDTTFSSYTTASAICSSTSGYGCYYNYQAATAGTISGSSNSKKSTYDICPKGWRLPTGTSGSEQYKIAGNTWQSYNTTYKTEFDPVAAGLYSSGSPGAVGSYGYWWSSEASNTSTRYYLYYFPSSGLRSGGNDLRYRGYSVRCVRPEPITTIVFNSNGGSGSMSELTVVSGNSITLSGNTFTAPSSNYVFAGWNTAVDGSGTSYADGASYTAAESEAEITVTLYAQWRYPMQTYTASQCASESSNAAVTLVDTRDNTTYRVRYINGACWMTQNLRFIPTSGMTLSATTTQIASDRTLGTVGALTSGNTYTEARIQNSGSTSTGVWYNYCAASAGTNCSQTQIAEANAQSICPAGWKLPTNSQFQAIANNSTYSSAFSPIYGGYYSYGVPYGSSTSGNWWSSTPTDINYQDYLSYISGSLTVGTNYKSQGRYVRCVRSS